jgi:hypothetical protein
LWLWRLTSKIRVIELCVSKAVVVEYLQFRAICFCNVCKIGCIVLIYIFWIRISSLVAEMVPIRRCKSEFGRGLQVRGQEVFEVVPLVYICGPDVLDGSYTKDGFGANHVFMEERSYIWDC